MTNPWIDLPAEAPFVLEIDKPYLGKIGPDITNLMFNVRPEPYVGSVDKAEVIFLLLNPGYVPEDVLVNQDPYYQQQNHLNLRHQAKPNFYYLDPKLAYSGGYIWWAKKLKALVRTPEDITRIADKSMCVEYLPYHSTRYRHNKQVLPSQKYGFNLVRQAVKQGKIIVMMRSERIWLDVVPELRGYPYIKLRNPQNTAISPGNMELLQFEAIKSRIFG